MDEETDSVIIFSLPVLSIIVYGAFQKCKQLLTWCSNWFLSESIFDLVWKAFGVLFRQKKKLAYSLKWIPRKQSNFHRRFETNITAPSAALTMGF